MSVNVPWTELGHTLPRCRGCTRQRDDAGTGPVVGDSPGGVYLDRTIPPSVGIDARRGEE